MKANIKKKVIWLRADCGCVIWEKVGKNFTDSGKFEIKSNPICKVHNKD